MKYAAVYVSGVDISNLPCFYSNVFLDLDGTIKKLPFDAKRDGIWLFDGQIFYQSKKEYV